MIIFAATKLARKFYKELRKKILYTVFILIGFAFIFSSCDKKKEAISNNVFDADKKESTSAVSYDLDAIYNGGELIAVTLSGPESYYEYQGNYLGRDFLLAELFAQSEGVRLRMDVAKDTTDLIKILKRGDADIIALELPESLLKKNNLVPSGTKTDSLKTAWAVRRESPQLSAALRQWYSDKLKQEAHKEESKAFGIGSIKRKVHAPFVSRSKGIISPYDAEFKRHAFSLGWDWRLLAAQCYQESGFDCNAVSWAGAKGLMQIMPATAAHLGLGKGDMYNPKANIAAGVAYLRELSGRFSDIASPAERIKFVLAAYNGGFYHIRDAMRLTKKYGKNSHAWSDVSGFVLKLSQRAYYTDAVVKNGYMIGSQTHGYVASIMQRWEEYRNGASKSIGGGLHFAPEPATKKNRFSKSNKILGKDDAIFANETSTPTKKAEEQ